MRKELIGSYLRPETAERLKATAADLGVPHSELNDLCIRYALAELPDDRLRAWAASLPNIKGRLRGGLTKTEQLCDAAMERMTAKSGGTVTRYETASVATEAGLLRRDAHQALKRLEARGLVVGTDDAEAGEDRWGRPARTVWRRTGG